MLFRQSYACFDQTSEDGVTGFRCKNSTVPELYLHIKSDDEIKGNPFEFQAYFPIGMRPKLNWHLDLALFAARFRCYRDL